jgi:hypothetical protein
MFGWETEAAIISGGNLAYRGLAFFFFLLPPPWKWLIFGFKEKLFENPSYLTIATKLITLYEFFHMNTQKLKLSVIFLDWLQTNQLRAFYVTRLQILTVA